MRFVRTLLTATALSAGLLAATAASAQTTLRYAVGFPTGAAPEAARVYAEAVKKYTDNTVQLRVFDLSLLNLAEMSSGLGQGIADIGYVLTPYTPAEYPHVNMASELSMLLALQNDPSGKAGMAFAGAIAEFIFTQCAECNVDFARQGQVYTGTGGSSPYMLLCTKPIRTVADLKGARLRAGGAAWARWARQVGATPVSMPGNEIFEAMKQKVVECSIQSAPELSGLNLKEVTTDITPALPGGVFTGATTNMNQGTWRKLTEAQRRGMLRAGTVMGAQTTFRYYTYAKRDMEQAIAKGAKVHQADPELLKVSRAAIEADIPNIGAVYTRQHNVKRADALVAAMRPLVTKWTQLVEPIDNADALADLYWNEVYSKVDVKVHGMTP
ncbi:MAG: TRAP transporter substrate-binding protein DctP [Hydrogenophaga sp.]|jgi:TRAP-type C4-dicarboxylate transport system substrate-binding protein|nr:TRAP transporter substrate-binding protein DctP [Hydrogenophaga sp.]